MNVMATAKIIAARTRFLLVPVVAVVITILRCRADIVAHRRNQCTPGHRLDCPGHVRWTTVGHLRLHAREPKRALLAIFLLAVVASAGLALVAAPGTASAGSPLPGAPNCPMFPADNVWNTNISALPVDPHSAEWLASMDSSTTNLHPDFGPSGDPANPYGIPYTVVSPSQPLTNVTFQYADESDPGPYPFGPDTPIEGGAQSTGDRHALMVNPSTCTLYELYDAQLQRVGLHRRLRGDLEPQLERPASERLDLGRRRRPADPAGAPALRRGAVGQPSPTPSA